MGREAKSWWAQARGWDSLPSWHGISGSSPAWWAILDDTRKVRGWLNHLGVKTLFIEPGSPQENGYIESFNGKLWDGLLNREIFTTLTEAKALIADCKKEYN
jgi:transposase InsO family protein